MTDTATALTINDIVSTASLDVEFLAGASGGSREVLWAHSCEMPNPARWLAPHELLMTVGLCVPTDAADQVTFLTSLYDAQLAGLMIGDHETAPPLSKEMLAEADKLGFPVMLAGEQTPYAVVARHVAAANTSSQTLQVLKLSKLYHVAAEAGHDPATLITDLVSLLGVGIRIEDRPTGLPVLHADATGRSGTATASRRYPLRGNYPADLMLLEYPGEELDSFLLVHLIKVLEVAVDGVLRNADRRAEISARVMLALLNGNTPAEATTLIEPHLPSSGFHLLAFGSVEGIRIARAVALLDLPVIVGQGRTSHLALVPSDAVPQMRELVASLEVRVGVSSVFTDLADVRVASQEAAKVFEANQHGQPRWIDFEGTTVSVLARSLREATEIVAGTLGHLADDAPAMAKLRDTLFAYLRNDRRWQESATELGIHRQTLSYRLNRIEEETGLKLARSSDLAALWIAYQAWEATHPR